MRQARNSVLPACRRSLHNLRGGGLDQSIDALIQAVVAWAGNDGVQDDVAILAAEVGP
jgi:hypothetical protein